MRGGGAGGGAGTIGLEGLESRRRSALRLLRLAVLHGHHVTNVTITDHMPRIHDAAELSCGDPYRRDHCKCHCQPSKSLTDPREPVGGFTCHRFPQCDDK